MKKLIKDQGIKPEKIATHLTAKKNSRSPHLNIKKELIKIRNIIKNASKVKIK